MAKATVKNIAERMMNESMGFGFDDIFPRSSQEAGPVNKVGDTAVFVMTFHRARGYPKSYKVTVEEIQ